MKTIFVFLAVMMTAIACTTPAKTDEKAEGTDSTATTTTTVDSVKVDSAK